MNLLTAPLPTTVFIDGISYQINTDFRTSIEFELLMQDAGSSDEEKISGAISLYYPVLPPDNVQAVEQLLWFYRCGKDPAPASPSGGAASGPAYSFEVDSGYIYAAFLADYRIDLQVTSLHWWAFRALFESLREENQIVKIMGYRTVKITGNMSKEQKAFYKRMKQLHTLKAATDTGSLGYAAYKQRMITYVDTRFAECENK